MHSLALFVALMLGQINPSTPTPTPKGPYCLYEITYQGMDITVEGRKLPDGDVIWESDRTFNVQSLKSARVARDEANEAAKQDYTDRFGIRHVWPKRPSPPTLPQEDAAPRTGQVSGDYRTHGVQPHFMGSERKGFTTSSDEGRRFIQQLQEPVPNLDSIAGKVHVTIIGTEDQRKAVMSDLESHPSLVPLKDGILVQGYEPGTWAVDPKLGFQPGTPAIMIMSGKSEKDPQGGKVLWRATDYKGGAERLAEAIRKANPQYKPELDPGIAQGTKTSACPLGFTSQHWPLIAGAGGLMLWIASRKKGAARA